MPFLLAGGARTLLGDRMLDGLLPGQLRGRRPFCADIRSKDSAEESGTWALSRRLDGIDA
jgi:hypothetical protein